MKKIQSKKVSDQNLLPNQLKIKNKIITISRSGGTHFITSVPLDSSEPTESKCRTFKEIREYLKKSNVPSKQISTFLSKYKDQE